MLKNNSSLTKINEILNIVRFNQHHHYLMIYIPYFLMKLQGNFFS